MPDADIVGACTCSVGYSFVGLVVVGFDNVGCWEVLE